MRYAFSSIAFIIFAILVSSVLALSFYLGRRAKSARGYFAAHGEVHWFVNGIAFAGDYLSAASFLGICGLIAFYGYDGFLYSIGFLAGWVVALFVIAEPIKRLGKFTFADALDSQFNSRGIKLTAAVSTLIVSLFYLIPQMVGAGALIRPLLGLEDLHIGSFAIDPFVPGVVLVGGVVIVIVVTAGMVSTTWVQFIKGSLLVLFCGGLALALLHKGLAVKPADEFPRILSSAQFKAQLAPSDTLSAHAAPWGAQHLVKVSHADGMFTVWKYTGMARFSLGWPAATFIECQVRSTTADGAAYVNGMPQTLKNNLRPTGFVVRLPDEREHTPGQGLAEENKLLPDRTQSTGPLGPLSFLATLQGSSVALPKSIPNLTEKDADGKTFSHTVYYAMPTAGEDILRPGGHPTLFAGLVTKNPKDRLNFISFMLALFCGTAALPHILIRYYTVKNQAAARKSTVVGIAAIGLFYILTLYLGLGAMTSGMLDPKDSNMAAPLLAKAFGEIAFALISAIAFTTVLGTVSGLIIAAAGAVAHDLMSNLLKHDLDDHAKVRAGKIAAVCVGLIGIVLGILFKDMNVSFLVGWAFNIAASANLPAITMLLFWKGTTKKGITASILVGLISSLAWIFLSTDAYANLYKLNLTQHPSPVPFNQPALVTIPLAYLTLIVVSLATKKTRR